MGPGPAPVRSVHRRNTTYYLIIRVSINMQTMFRPTYVVERPEQLRQWIAIKLDGSVHGYNRIGWSSVQTRLNLSGSEAAISSRKSIINSSLPDSLESCSKIRWLTLELFWTGADNVNACWKHLSLRILSSLSVATHPSDSVGIWLTKRLVLNTAARLYSCEYQCLDTYRRRS